MTQYSDADYNYAEEKFAALWKKSAALEGYSRGLPRMVDKSANTGGKSKTGLAVQVRKIVSELDGEFTVFDVAKHVVGFAQDSICASVFDLRMAGKIEVVGKLRGRTNVYRRVTS